MTKRKNVKDAHALQAVDLVELLTLPGRHGTYDFEISGDIYTEPEKESEKAPEKAKIAITKKLENTKKPLKSTKPCPWEQTIEIAGDSLEKIAYEISNCTKCDLHKTRTNTVPGEGSEKAKLVFIGEAPGEDEDKTGKPFVGKAGKHLDKILAAAGFKKEELFICNILKCRPPGNRNPSPKEIASCCTYIHRQLKVIRPALLSTLGNIAMHHLIGPKTPGISRIHGQWLESVPGIDTMPLYHPSYLLRSSSRAKGSPNWQMWQDIQLLKKAYDSV